MLRNISAVAPEIVHPELVSLNDPEVCARACAQLLAKVGSLTTSLQLKYRLEVLPSIDESSKWKLRVKLDSVAWFDYWKLLVNEKDLAIKAREYVKAAQNKLDNLPPVDYCEHELVESRRYCFIVDCKFGSWCKNGHHVAMGLCGQPIERADGSKPKCTFGIIYEFAITAPDFSFPEFNVSVKRDPARQIMLSPKKHVPNYVLMTDVNTWNTIETVYTTLSKKINAFALEGIAVNFGKWETASAKDESEYALDCHGHFYMHLSRVAVNTLSDIDGWKSIHGRVKHPENYLDKDIHELEVRRLIPLEKSVIWGELGSFRKDLADIRATVSALSNTVTSLQGTVTSLQGTVTSLQGTVTSLQGTVTSLQGTNCHFTPGNCHFTPQGNTR
eukprot:Em0003g443a